MKNCAARLLVLTMLQLWITTPCFPTTPASRSGAVYGLAWEAVTHWQSTREVIVPERARHMIVERVDNQSMALAIDAEKRGLNDTEFGIHVRHATESYLDRIYTTQSCGSPDPSKSTQCQWVNLLDESFIHETVLDYILSIFSSMPQLGYLTLKTSPSNGEIYIDGNFQGYTVKRFAMSPGVHDYRLVVPDQGGTKCGGRILIEEKREYSRKCP